MTTSRKLYYVEDYTGMRCLTHDLKDNYRLIETWYHEDKKWAYAQDPTKEVEVKVFKSGMVCSYRDGVFSKNNPDGACMDRSNSYDLVPLQEPPREFWVRVIIPTGEPIRISESTLKGDTFNTKVIKVREIKDA